MTTTAADLTYTRRAGRRDSVPRAVRRAPRRPVIDLAPWIAPFAWMTVLAVTVCALGAAAMLRDGVPSAAPATIAVRVAPSDTLWSIAEANRVSGLSTAATVEMISRMNGLRTTSITPGTVLRVPTVEVADTAFAKAEDVTITR